MQLFSHLKAYWGWPAVGELENQKSGAMLLWANGGFQPVKAQLDHFYLSIFITTAYNGVNPNWATVFLSDAENTGACFLEPLRSECLIICIYFY